MPHVGNCVARQAVGRGPHWLRSLDYARKLASLGKTGDDLTVDDQEGLVDAEVPQLDLLSSEEFASSSPRAGEACRPSGLIYMVDDAILPHRQSLAVSGYTPQADPGAKGPARSRSR